MSGPVNTLLGKRPHNSPVAIKGKKSTITQLQPSQYSHSIVVAENHLDHLPISSITPYNWLQRNCPPRRDNVTSISQFNHQSKFIEIASMSMPSDHPSIYPRVMHHPPTHNEAAPRLPYSSEHHPMVHQHFVNQPRLHTEYNGGSMIGGFGMNNSQVSYGPPPPPLNEYGYYQGRMRNNTTSTSHEPSHTRNALHPNMHHQQGPSSYPYQTTEHAFHPPDNSISGESKAPLSLHPALPPSLPPALPPPALEASHDDEPVVTNNLIGSRDEDGHPNLLWLPEDQQHLTDLHCFVRKHCVFIFGATDDDVDTPRKGRKKALTLGQIGIGCLHCKNSEYKLKGSTYFPTSISGIYNATMIIQQRHFPVCPSVSRETFCQYQRLKGLTARSASTKEYWVSAARKLGLVDTSKGVFFKQSNHVDETIPPPPQAVSIPAAAPLVCLVEPSDKIFATEYSYFVMEQMTTCVFTEADRLGKRKCHTVGFAGMACKHCVGGNGSGRFFPLTLKTFSDVSKSIHVLRNHLIKCTKAPRDMAETVTMLYKQHKNEKQTTPFGSQKIFFDRVWKRLHPELVGKEQKTGNETTSLKKKKAPTKSRRRSSSKRSKQSRNKHDATSSLRRDANDIADTTSPTEQMPPLPSPPTICNGKLTSHNLHQDVSRHNKELCMIPKKRYVVAQSKLQSQESSHDNKRRRVVSHSESDLSAAMILASGFGLIDSKSSDESTNHEAV